MTITIATTCYGDYGRFLPDWHTSVLALNASPDSILVEDSEPSTRYPQAELLNRLLERVETDWIWFLGVDNQALPDALDDLNLAGEDALLFGFRRDDGLEYIPAKVSNRAYLRQSLNTWPSDSLFRVESVREAGGFPMIGHEDWGLWRRMCRLGMVIRPTGRVHWLQRVHDGSRTRKDMQENRGLYLSEVLQT